MSNYINNLGIFREYYEKLFVPFVVEVADRVAIIIIRKRYKL